MITIKSGEGLELPPLSGDILMVRPPEILPTRKATSGVLFLVELNRREYIDAIGAGVVPEWRHDRAGRFSIERALELAAEFREAYDGEQIRLVPLFSPSILDPRSSILPS